MIFLSEISRKFGDSPPSVFPFTVPAVASLEAVRFAQPVTFFVGENGSGKSTLLEAVAAHAGLPTVGGEDVERDSALTPARQLAEALRFKWAKRTRRGFFLRAEDFFNFAARVRRLQEELESQYQEYKVELEDRPFADGLMKAMGSAKAQIADMKRRYGDDLNAFSHGESFLKLFGSRLAPDGLYLLDEPEAPLSPLRQIAFLSMLMDSTAQGCQFLIATHSPILMAFPGAAIYSFDDGAIRETPYDELEHVTLTRAFLERPESFLRRLNPHED